MHLNPCRNCRAAVLWLATLSIAVAFEPDPEHQARRTANLASVEQWTSQMRAEFGDNPDYMVEPGLLADRRNRQVRFQAEATGVEPGNALEFALISEHSGHDYEAVAVALVKPSVIHSALEFIGLPPGRPVDPAQLRFWPRGERVWVTCRWTEPEESSGSELHKQADIGTFMFNHRQQAPLPVHGFVFTGSQRRSHPMTGETVYAADAFGPGAIISLYNEPNSVMDVPRLAAQSDVYGAIVPNPEQILKAGTLLEIVLEPEYPPGRHRVFTGGLKILARGAGSDGTAKADLGFTIVPTRDDDQAPPLENGNLVELLGWLGLITENGRDPFVSLEPEGDVNWESLREFYRMVETLEAGQGIRIEPPADGHLYYRAFLPAAWFRDPDRRDAHPDELYLHGYSNGEAGPSALWRRFEEEWPAADVTESEIRFGTEPAIHVSDLDVVDAAALLEAQLELKYRPRPEVLLVFAPPQTPVAQLHQWMLPLRTVYPTQYVFEADADQK